MVHCERYLCLFLHFRSLYFRLIVEKEISFKLFLNLYWKAVNSHYINPINKVEKSKKSGPITIDNPDYKRVHIKTSNMRQYFLSTYRYNRSLTKEQK